MFNGNGSAAPTGIHWENTCPECMYLHHHHHPVGGAQVPMEISRLHLRETFPYCDVRTSIFPSFRIPIKAFKIKAPNSEISFKEGRAAQLFSSASLWSKGYDNQTWLLTINLCHFIWQLSRTEATVDVYKSKPQIHVKNDFIEKKKQLQQKRAQIRE